MARKSSSSKLKTTLKWGGALVGVAVVGAGVWLYDPLPENPGVELLSAEAANYNVEIVRDEWGVPHIFGETDADTSFGLAYANAEDDFKTIQETVAATRGVLARYRGAGAAPTDYIASFLGVWDTIDARYESDVDARVRGLATAYAAGMNLYAAKHPEATWAGLAPFTGEDVAAGFLLKTPLFYGLDKVILDLFSAGGPEQELRVGPLAGEDKAWNVGPSTGFERGSNAMAVAPKRSDDGKTRLLMNSHQPMTGPVAWYEAHMSSKEGTNILGATFPGAPFILMGFNEHLGWANTVNKPDLADVYELVRNPENPMQYRLDGEWKDFEVQTVEIGVHLFGPFVYPAKRQLLKSVHGPVIEGPGGTYAVRYAGIGEVRQMEQYSGLNRARNFEEFQAAMAINALPSINYVYADKSGNIAFIHNGQYPVRKAGEDWLGTLPGDRSDLIWQDYYDYERVPMLINPQSGLVFNANNAPYIATDGPDNMRPEDYPATMGLDARETNRSYRFVELSAANPVISRDVFLKIKFDTQYSAKSELASLVREVLAQDWSDETAYADAAAHLKGWNNRMDADNTHAAIAGMMVTRKILLDREAASYTAADLFRWSVDYLVSHFGRIDPSWGTVNRLVRGTVNLPVDGGPDTLRAIYAFEFLDGGQIKAVAGDTWIGIAEWDEEGRVQGNIIHQFGSATLDATSPHYADQAPLFAGEQWRKAMLSRAEVEARPHRTYRPGEE